ncbi:MAG TPA: hypothetical protein VFU23_06005 [Gemmatimonadales bacterium]|nr:hypothetical protein [Gemmatimonadales bacterium]
MDFGAYVTEKLAAARLGELRQESARLALLDRAGVGRRGLGPRLGIALTRLGRWLARDGTPARNAGVRVARVR